MEKETVSENNSSSLIWKRPLYWLIIVPRKSHVQIYYYSKIATLANSSGILSAVKEKIRCVEERTNQMALLNYLQENRICSAYLEAPNSAQEAEAYSDDDSDESASNENTSGTFDNIKAKRSREYRSNFLPGQFACPLVFTKRFPLHWRLQPNISLKFLASDVLRLFRVSNRPNMFVVERDGSIIYCRIYEEVSGENNHASPNTVCSSPGQTDRLKPIEEDSRTIASFNFDSCTKRETPPTLSSSPSKSRTLSSSRTINNETRELVVQVYGIDLPNWVEFEFIDMIENRLMTQITLTEVQQFFVRNSTSKPTLADVEFIFPVWKTSTRREMFRIPKVVDHPHLLNHFFSQILVTDNIKALNSPYLSGVLKEYQNDTFYHENRDVKNGTLRTQMDRNSKTLEDTLSSTRSFYYNCTKRVPGSSTPLELLVGQGLVGICITLLDETGQPMAKLKREGSRAYVFEPEAARRCLDQDFREVTSEDTYHHLAIDFWSIGSLDSDSLMQHLYECYRQSLCDYFVEKTVSMDFSPALLEKRALKNSIAAKSRGRLGTILRNKFVDSILYMLKAASQMNSPTVCCMNRAIKIAPWCMDDLLIHLESTLRKMDLTLRTVVASKPY
ncbi:hypothetical protein BY458DRAFT_429387, partial [Sporodiniella umbellata]